MIALIFGKTRNKLKLKFPTFSTDQTKTNVVRMSICVNPTNIIHSDSSSIQSGRWNEDTGRSNDDHHALVQSPRAATAKRHSIRSVTSSRTACTDSGRTDSTGCTSGACSRRPGRNRPPHSIVHDPAARPNRPAGGSSSSSTSSSSPSAHHRVRHGSKWSLKMPRTRLKYCRLAHYVDLAWFQCLACFALLLFVNRLFELNKDIAYLKHVSNTWLPNITIPSESGSLSSSALTSNQGINPSTVSTLTGNAFTATTPLPTVTAQIDGIQKEIELAKAKSAHFHVENLRKDVDALIGRCTFAIKLFPFSSPLFTSFLFFSLLFPLLSFFKLLQHLSSTFSFLFSLKSQSNCGHRVPL